MAQAGDTLIRHEALTEAEDLGKLLEAIRDLAHLRHLTALGAREAIEMNMDNGANTAVLLSTLLWPLDHALLRACELYRAQGKELEGLEDPDRQSPVPK